MDQRYRQQHGQLAPVQRKVAELERQNVNLLKHLDELQRARATELQGKSTDAFAKYKEMYPDEAEAHEARYAPLELQNKALLEEQRRTKESLDSIKYEIDLQKNSALVVKQHPDAYDILQDPVFEAWVSALDEDDQARANSSKASDAVKILDQFKRDKMLSELLDAQKSPTQPSRNKPRLDVDPTPRNRQSPAPQRAGNASGSEEEEYAAFAEAYEADPKMFQRARR